MKARSEKVEPRGQYTICPTWIERTWYAAMRKCNPRWTLQSEVTDSCNTHLAGKTQPAGLQNQVSGVVVHTTLHNRRDAKLYIHIDPHSPAFPAQLAQYKGSRPRHWSSPSIPGPADKSPQSRRTSQAPPALAPWVQLTKHTWLLSCEAWLWGLLQPQVHNLPPTLRQGPPRSPQRYQRPLSKAGRTKWVRCF